MKLKIRTKADGRLQVLDENGHPIDGVLSVSMLGDVGEIPIARITMRAGIAVDVKEAARAEESPAVAASAAYGAAAGASGSKKGR